LTGKYFIDVRALTVNDETGMMMGFSFPAAEKNNISGMKRNFGKIIRCLCLKFFPVYGLPANIEVLKQTAVSLLKHCRVLCLRNSLMLKLYNEQVVE
jgi:hypothetical protein